MLPDQNSVIRWWALTPTDNWRTLKWDPRPRSMTSPLILSVLDMLQRQAGSTLFRRHDRSYALEEKLRQLKKASLLNELKSSWRNSLTLCESWRPCARLTSWAEWSSQSHNDTWLQQLTITSSATRLTMDNWALQKMSGALLNLRKLPTRWSHLHQNLWKQESKRKDSLTSLLIDKLLRLNQIPFTYKLIYIVSLFYR